MKKIISYLILAFSLYNSLAYGWSIRVVPIAKDLTDQSWKLLLMPKGQKLVDIERVMCDVPQVKNKVVIAKNTINSVLKFLSLSNIASIDKSVGEDIILFVHTAFVTGADLLKKTQRFQKFDKGIPKDFAWIPVKDVIEGNTITLAAKKVDIDFDTKIMLDNYLKDAFEKLTEINASQGSKASSTKQLKLTNIDDLLKHLNVSLNKLNDELSAASFF